MSRKTSVLTSRVDDLRSKKDRAITRAKQINLAVWGVAAGTMIYGAVNVTMLVVEHDVPWPIAPLLSLMVDLGLCVALWSAPVLAEYSRTSGWVNILRWVTAIMSWALNAAKPALAFTAVAGAAAVWSPDWTGVFIHSCGPVLLIVVAEAAASLQRTLAEIVRELEKAVAEAERALAEHHAAAQVAAQRSPVSAHASWGAPLTAQPDERPSQGAAQPDRRALTGEATGPATAGHHGPAGVGGPGSAAVEAAQQQGRPPLHLVTPPPAGVGLAGQATASTAPGGPVSQPGAAASQQPNTAETTDPEVRMREFWDTSVAAGRVPTGAELARAGGVSPATGRRRRADWEAGLPVHLRGGDSDAASA
jgi:hypothetical protein